MSGFSLITSNRLEHLISVLADMVRQPLKNPFSPEIIIVQNRGMERLLSLRLSETLGIWSNCIYPFPSAYFQSLFQKAIPELPPRLLFDPEYLSWRIMATLPELLKLECYKSLASYLHGTDQTALFELSAKIADQFDRYTVYRSPMVKNWQKGEESHWQADLWRRLNTGKQDHRVQIGSQIAEKILNTTFPPDTLPERISVFGVSTLPPFHSNLLHLLSKSITIYYYLLNPSAEYWDDICSEKEIAKKIRKLKKRRKKMSSEPLHFEQGNPILASMGAYGQEFIRKLHTLDVDEYSLPVDPGEHTVLQIIQSDILYLRTRGTGLTPKLPISPDDRSLQIHSCHSVMREVEVLYDQLIDLFATTADLKPSDIVVMTPDINVYAAAIIAVFGSAQQQEMKIPFSLSDRCGNGSNTIQSLFLKFLEIPGSRFGLTVVLELLDFEMVRNAFSLSKHDCEMITRWIRDTGIRWGIDGESKKVFDCPPFDENTWKRGIDQLILGYALPSELSQPFMEMYGYEHIEGSMAVPLGNFIDFYKSLVDFHNVSRQPHTLSNWAETLLAVIDRFICPDSTQVKEITVLRNAVTLLKEIEISVNYLDLVSFDCIKSKLAGDLSRQFIDQGFLNGGVTFCSMLPMRGIPFRVVCCIGMGDSALPRKSSFTSWDLIASNPQAGDRSLEHEDRYLFLEALCSARDTFYVSFIKDPRGKSSGERQSVVVDELLDYCDHAFFVPQNTTCTDATNSPSETSTQKNVIINCEIMLSERLTIRHKLQAFNPAYFIEPSTHFSYSTDNCDAAKALLGDKASVRAVFEHRLPEPENDFRNITVTDLIHFFCNPSDFFLTRRLGIALQSRFEAFDDEEPFDLQGLEKYQFADRYIESVLKGDQTHYLDKEVAYGALPHGRVGEYHRKKLVFETEEFIDHLRQAHSKFSYEKLTVILRCGPFSISGSLGNVSGSGALHYRYADTKATDRLQLWITHLLLQAQTMSSSIISTLFCKDGVTRYRALDNPIEILSTLCNWYWRGLSQPIHFFPQTSWTYRYEISVKQTDHEKALRVARREWYGNDYFREFAECEKHSNRLLFSKIDPLDEEFIELANAIIQPIIGCNVEVV